ncbi:hypothetical protein LIA77_04504 [Sarocladium implicatum]|nr:hypothetical protein LIA77_04504 [Sarocladium implicatum]
MPPKPNSPSRQEMQHSVFRFLLLGPHEWNRSSWSERWRQGPEPTFTAAGIVNLGQS